MKTLLKITFAAAFLATAIPVSATDFVDGEFVSFSQSSWGSKPPIGPPGTIILAPAPPFGQNFDLVYPNGITLGLEPPHRRVIFDTGDAVIAYMPQPGPPGAFDSNMLDPGGPSQSTSSGVFGGQMVALYLNIDFNDAGLIGGTSKVRYGDLILGGYDGALAGLDGLTIRQFRTIANTAIGGGTTPFSIADLSAQLMLINASFEGGFPTSWAPTHLFLPDITTMPETPVPEPSEWAMLVVGFGIVGSAMRRAGFSPMPKPAD
jgi:hypothetical protein